MVLAIVAPVVGLVLGLVSRSRAKRQGYKDDLATLAAVIGGILTGLLAVIGLGVIAFQVIYASISTAGANNQIVLDVSAGEGEVDRELLGATLASVNGRLERAGAQPTGVFSGGDDSVVITFSDGTPESEVNRVALLFTGENRSGFSPVLDVYPSEGEPDEGKRSAQEIEAFETPCEDLLVTEVVWDGGEILCEITGWSTFLLDDVRIDGSEVSSVEKPDDYTFTMTLSDVGAAAFGDLTEEASAATDPNRTRIALVSNREVLTAPSVAMRIDDGKVQISDPGAGIDDLFSEVLLMSRSVDLQVRSIHTGG